MSPLTDHSTFPSGILINSFDQAYGQVLFGMHEDDWVLNALLFKCMMTAVDAGDYPPVFLQQTQELTAIELKRSMWVLGHIYTHPQPRIKILSVCNDTHYSDTKS
ncbi:protein of unknown function [Candidatus Filomicrobium marinum]|uniref:Uncharacterized protein n=1 Tax=Candidatus Filomicrobium marinum TaxID=1608628 RepID=A0A0D6JCU4_9HYPH|nr:protein of unknown function [Candidatus Filomicrobium marinum]CPR16503.1 protein of unknown function [Candidatus Filomicrobium marinum]